MTTANNKTISNKQNEDYSYWIIKYCSPNFEHPLFLVWYTDTDKASTDRLLTYRSGEILAVASLVNLYSTLLSQIDSLTISENFKLWVDGLTKVDLIADNTYNLISVSNNIKKGSLDINTFEDFANFINLYDDFINQDERNNYLQIYADNELIKGLWDYFYNFIFWPRFNDKEKFDVSEIPNLEIDTKDLLIKLQDILNSFDKCINIAEKAIC
ncbi:hypothetical protein [Kaistella jeonii]|uniref:Uncharacterized protein n=1 Tax=Kaistella jeonii TaxID=266749 RepID=A0A0C1CRY8_9FLAO|nr:hypothetical protein [Kaistella jeonii]KIA83955.1 hypothetical protein OA86_14955 [Kaistella jeonii]SFC43245.1 hypothetical protein SAMN05421876_12210 [Kaistella jeonii]VEI96535.1 Uncharacterised protein [Kaistella jeonii]